MITESELKAMRERCERATEGDPLRTGALWMAREFGGRRYQVCTRDLRHVAFVDLWDDADFIAHARTDMPRLLDEVDLLRAECERLRRVEAGLRSFFVATLRGSEVTVEWRGPRLDGGVSWAVLYRSNRLSRRGEWDYEPFPSSRTDEWISAHSWPTFSEALDAALRAAGGGG